MQDLHTTLLLPTELVTVSRQILELLKTVPEPFLQKLGGVVESDIAQLSSVLARDRTNAYTDLLFSKDQVRDSSYRSFRDLVRSGTQRTDPAVAKAAETVFGIVKRHGLGLYRLGYPQQSAKLNALIADLASHSAAVQTVGAEAVFAELKAAQADFEDTFQNKITDDTRTTFPELADAFQALATDLALLLDNIAILPRLTPPISIAEIEPKLDALITEIMGPARARRTRDLNRPDTTPPTGDTASSASEPVASV